jgi:hypothetical protein
MVKTKIDQYPEPCATSEGKPLRKKYQDIWQASECSLFPRDRRSQRVDIGLLDFSTLNNSPDMMPMSALATS